MSERDFSHGSHVSSTAPDPMSAAGQIDPAVFLAHLDTTFRVDTEADRIPLRLAEVIDGASSGGLRRFSILFHGPADRALPQGMYTFHHDALGSLVLFIVPVIGSNDERIVYEACFSRPIPAPPAP